MGAMPISGRRSRGEDGRRGRAARTGGRCGCARRRSGVIGPRFKARPRSLPPKVRGRGPVDPPAKNIRCDAKDPARPRTYLEQNTFSKRGVQVEPKVALHIRPLRYSASVQKPRRRPVLVQASEQAQSVTAGMGQWTRTRMLWTVVRAFALTSKPWF